MPYPNGWVSTQPPKGILIQMAGEDGRVFIGYAEDYRTILCWAMTGIGKHQLEPDNETIEKRIDAGHIEKVRLTGNLSKSASRGSNRKGR